MGLVAQPSVHYCTTPAQVPVESTEGASVPMREKKTRSEKKEERKKSKKEEVHVAATAFLTIGPAARSGTIACPPIEGDGSISIADIICSIIFRNKQKKDVKKSKITAGNYRFIVWGPVKLRSCGHVIGSDTLPALV